MACRLFLVFAVASSVSMNCPIRASFCVCMTVYTGHIPERGITTSEVCTFETFINIVRLLSLEAACLSSP